MILNITVLFYSFFMVLDYCLFALTYRNYLENPFWNENSCELSQYSMSYVPVCKALIPS